MKTAPFWNVTHNIIIPRVANFTPLLHLNQAETSNAVKNVFNNVQGYCQGREIKLVAALYGIKSIYLQQRISCNAV